MRGDIIGHFKTSPPPSTLSLHTVPPHHLSLPCGRGISAGVDFRASLEGVYPESSPEQSAASPSHLCEMRVPPSRSSGNRELSRPATKTTTMYRHSTLCFRKHARHRLLVTAPSIHENNFLLTSARRETSEGARGRTEIDAAGKFFHRAS